jgi:NTE family protein
MAACVGPIPTRGSPSVSTDAKPSGSGAKAQRAVVLGGGGLTGYAWEVGILKGLRDAGIDLTVADLIIGTSAGSILGTQIRSGKAVDDLYASMLAPPSGGSPPARSPADVQYLQDTYRLWLTGAENTATMRVEVGKRALETPHPIAEEAQKNRWRRMLGISEWPNQPLKISAVDITDGAVRFFDRSQDVGIETAAAASTAIPGLHAPITVGDRRYMDGGVATTGIDAALGYGTVVAITTGGGQLVRQQVELVRSGGSRIVNVSPDAESLSALGTDRMVASQAKPSAEAGLRQAGMVVEEVRKVWTGATSTAPSATTK